MQLVDVPAVTLDGVNIVLQANIELPIESGAALKQGAQGVGLFRSEFLFLDRDTLPTEEEQFQAYCAALNAMQGREVTIRTIDVGADKALPQQKVDAPANPALGERAIRFSLKHPEIFTVQLRALLRASACGPIRILIPMLAHRFEVEATKQLLAHAREQLQREGIPMASFVPIGAMIEIPAAAIEADWFAQAFDFLSIGTNDLVQYTLAVDRTDHQVAQLYDSHHPAVLSLIRTTVNACNKHGKPVTVCGEMAGLPDSAQLLIEMGIRQLSMQPQSILAVKERILSIRSEAQHV
jgi:phosphoenolpyruvate-protein phosphotransferase (PTS system enzyme I)